MQATHKLLPAACTEEGDFATVVVDAELIPDAPEASSSPRANAIPICPVSSRQKGRCAGRCVKEVPQTKAKPFAASQRTNNQEVPQLVPSGFLHLSEHDDHLLALTLRRRKRRTVAFGVVGGVAGLVALGPLGAIVGGLAGALGTKAVSLRRERRKWQQRTTERPSSQAKQNQQPLQTALSDSALHSAATSPVLVVQTVTAV